MGYQDLLRALDEEVAREAGALREAGEREAGRVLEEARAAAEAELEARLARQAGALAAERRSALAREARERERRLLEVSRGILQDLRSEALRRLAGRAAELVPRLAAEIAAELAEGPATWIVDPGAEGALRAWLARERPDLAGRAAVMAAAEARGGVEVVQGRSTLDDTLPARLERAWPELEPRLAALLFGGEAGLHGDRERGGL